MLRKSFWSTALAIAAGLAAGNAASAASPEKNGPVRLLSTIPVPVAMTNATGGMYAFDISFVDQSNHHYYLADGSNATVDVVNAKTGIFVKQITASPPFAGVKLNTMGTAVNNNISGPDGSRPMKREIASSPATAPAAWSRSRFPAARRSATSRRAARPAWTNGVRPEGQTAAGGKQRRNTTVCHHIQRQPDLRAWHLPQESRL